MPSNRRLLLTDTDYGLLKVLKNSSNGMCNVSPMIFLCFIFSPCLIPNFKTDYSSQVFQLVKVSGEHYFFTFVYTNTDHQSFLDTLYCGTPFGEIIC